MQTSSRRKFSTKLVAGAVVIAAVAAWYFTRGDEQQEAAQPLLARVQMGSIENTIASSGTLKPFEFVDVGAQVSGQLKKLYVEVGDVVTAGQLLAEIDARVQEAKVTASRASIAAQEATLDARDAALALARANGERQERLRDANASSQLEYDTAQNNLASAVSSLEQLQKQIEQSKATLFSDETQLEFTKIYAPTTGTVVSISMTEGRTLNSVQQAPTILRIANLGTMTVEAEISEADISSIKAGMPVYFTTLGSGERRWYATVRQVLPTPTVTNNVVLYTGLFDIENADSALYSEMTAQVYFVTSAAENVVTVPVGALKFGPPAGAAAFAGRAAGNAEGAGSGNPAAAGSVPPAGGPPAGFTPGAAPPEGFRPPGGGNGQGRRPGGGAGGRGGFAAAAVNPNAPRAATVTVVKDDGTQEERQVMVGISSRVAAEVISGLAVGEQVVAGIIQPDSEDAAAGGNNQNNNRGGFPGGGAPPFMRF